MPLLLTVAYKIIGPIILIVGLAMLVDRRFAPNLRALSTLAFYVFIPALVLDGMAHSDIQPGEIGLILAMVVLLSLAMALIGWGQARALGFDRKLESAMMLSVMMVNAGNYGLALNDFAFGAAGLQRAIIFYIGTSLINNTLGVFLASRGTASIGRSLLNTLAVPLPYATILGLVLNFGQFSLPLPVDRAIGLLGQAAVPTMLTILGLQLSRTSLKGKLKPLILATTARLIVAPVIAFGLVALLGMSGLTRQVSIVQSSMPTAVVTTIIATEFGSDPEFTSAVILISTLASVVSLSILLTLIM